MKHFSLNYLRKVLAALPTTPRYWVAYSGGSDSHALLHACVSSKLGPEVRAIHVNHGLDANASHWVTHCRTESNRLGVELEVCCVDLQRRTGRSLEAFARDKRYAVMRDVIGAQDILLTAHTQDDQAETLLLQLLRGAGPAGLSAMPERMAFGDGWLVRPLLGVSRKQVHRYAADHRLSVIQDPSNAALRFDRNFLRREILPRLERRWPSTAATLSRAASHQAEATVLVNDVGVGDLESCSDVPTGTISCQELAALTSARRHNLLRVWIRTRGFDPPPTNVIRLVDEEVLTAKKDSNPLVCWAETQLRRYRDRLYLMRPLSQFSRAPYTWQMTMPLALPHGVLATVECVGRGLRLCPGAESGVDVRFRAGTERCQPDGRGHSQSLKRLFQEVGVEPWRRDRIPLIYIDNKLAAVVGHWTCKGYAAAPGEPARQLSWWDSALD